MDHTYTATSKTSFTLGTGPDAVKGPSVTLEDLTGLDAHTIENMRLDDLTEHVLGFVDNYWSSIGVDYAAWCASHNGE